MRLFFNFINSLCTEPSRNNSKPLNSRLATTNSTNRSCKVKLKPPYSLAENLLKGPVLFDAALQNTQPYRVQEA